MGPEADKRAARPVNTATSPKTKPATRKVGQPPISSHPSPQTRKRYSSTAPHESAQRPLKARRSQRKLPSPSLNSPQQDQGAATISVETSDAPDPSLDDRVVTSHRPLPSVELDPEGASTHLSFGTLLHKLRQQEVLQEDYIGQEEEEAFYQAWRYLPPFDEEMSALIEEILEDPSKVPRISPKDGLFDKGLMKRNVNVKKSTEEDLYFDHIDQLPDDGPQESLPEKSSQERLWKLDREKCLLGTSEHFFQRTLMMNLISRQCLIYQQDTSHLDFTVEGLWTCPPMPTRDYYLDHAFCTQPKPDLSISFKRTALIDDATWIWIPSGTARLAEYESSANGGSSRIFHFFTIEGKRDITSTDDPVAKRQSLNSASQSLHNMYEFLKDAGQEYENKFFDQVRVFSAVATADGLLVRIHRAERIPDDRPVREFITKGYPLKFEFREFARVPAERYDRSPVFDIFRKVLCGTIVNTMRTLLASAADTLVERLMNDENGLEYKLRRDSRIYRHGQVDKPKGSGPQTPISQKFGSVMSKMSVDHAGTTTSQSVRPGTTHPTVD